MIGIKSYCAGLLDGRETYAEIQEQLSQGRILRGNFDGRRIELPVMLFEELEYIKKMCKKRGLPANTISSMIVSAVSHYLYGIYDNGCLDPDSHPDDSPYEIMYRIVENLPLEKTKKELIEIARNLFRGELEHTIDKTLENYISEARRAIKRIDKSS